MHKKQNKNNEEISELKQEITTLKKMVTDLVTEIRNGNTITTLPKVPTAKTSPKKINNGNGRKASETAIEFQNRFTEFKEKFSCFKDFEKWG